MRWLILVTCLVIPGYISLEIPGFNRAAVQGSPRSRSDRLDRSLLNEERVPLRDAVEGRPDPQYAKSVLLGIEPLLSPGVVDETGDSISIENSLLPYVNQPTKGKGFQRGSVEGSPRSRSEKLDRSLINEERVPLRDAVEGRPDPQYVKSVQLGIEPLLSPGVIDETGDSISVENSLLPFVNQPTKGKGFQRGSVEGRPNNFEFLRKAAHKPSNAHTYDENVSKVEDKESVVVESPTLVRNPPTTSERGNEGFKVICYWGAWSIYRPSPMDFHPGDLDPFGCTHIIYSFTGLENSSLTVVPLDSDYDIIQGGYKATLALKQINPSLKVMVAIGGWNEGGKKYSQMASSKESRTRFIDSVIAFLNLHGFDGFDLDWEYPGATDRQGAWADKENFARLVEELSLEFKPRGWLLSAAVSPAIFRVNEGYDVPRVSKGLDFINVMTYDLHGAWDNYADHHAPISQRPFDEWGTANLNADGGLSYWIKQGAPAEKVMFGIPFYGRAFTLGNAQNTNPRSSIKGPGKAGKYSQEPGFLAYYEICSDLADGGWTEKKDPVHSPYIFKGDQWIGYDTEEYVTEKMNYIIRKGLGGAMIWAIDLDDFRGVCGKKWPLLTAVNKGLGRDFQPGSLDIVTSPRPTTIASTTEAIVTPGSTTEFVTPGSTTEFVTPASTTKTTAAPTTTSAPGTEPSVFPTIAPSGSNCPPGGNGFVRDPNNCGLFYQCAGGIKFAFACPGGLWFDSSLNICNWPAAVADCTQSSIVLKDNLDNFGCEQDGLYNNPNDCASYYWCTNGLKYPLTCGPNLHFDATFGVCNYPGLANCNPGVKTLVKTLDSYPNQIDNQADFRVAGEKKLFCYSTSWSWTRTGEGSFVPENIDPFLCTHIVYAYAVLDPETLVVRSGDKWTDIDNKMYARVMSLKKKNPSLSILLGLGGWSDSGEDKYSRLVGSAQARTKFAAHVSAFLSVNGFDGLHLDWQYPKCWNLDCSKGPETDRANFGQFLKDLRSVFSGLGLELSASLSSNRQIIDLAYDVPAISESLDFITVMTYDYHGPWEKKTGYISPLKSSDGMDVESTMNYLEFKGFPKNKMLVGMATYGRSFWLQSANQNTVGAPSKGSGSSGPFTKEQGLMAYYEICDAAKNLDWTNKVTQSGSYITSETSWVSYDGPEAFAEKADFITASGYGGAAVWSLDLDDFSNRCCEEAFPLVKALARGLGLRNDRPSSSCTKPTIVTPPPVNFTTDWNEGEYQPGTTTPLPFPTPTTSRMTSPTPSTLKPASTPKTTSGVTSTTSRSSTQAPVIPTRCVSGNYYPSPDGDCGKFAVCSNEELIIQRCAGALYWNKFQKYCDYPENVDCSSAQVTLKAPINQPMEQTVDQPVVNIESLLKIDTSPCQIGIMKSMPGNCNQYQFCVNSVWLTMPCPMGLHWNQVAKICDWPASANCKEETTPSTATPPVTSTITTARPTVTAASTTGRTTVTTKTPSTTVTTTTPSTTVTTKTPSTTAPTSVPSTTPITTTRAPTGATSTISPKPSGNDQVKVICYFTNWAWYRPGDGKYTPDNIDSSLCTHIVYGFATLDYTDLVMKPYDSWADLDNKFYEKVVALRQKGVHVAIALGGWNDSAGDKYSRLVNNPASRKKFIDNAVQFIEKYGFDGLDLDWEYPKCWQVDCTLGPASDKQNFALWVKELSAALKPRGWTLSAAVSPSKAVIDVGYDVPALSQYLDWIGVMTYDYHGNWDKKTGHVSPLFYYPGDDYDYFNTNFTINYWLSLGATKDKIAAGVPLYGQSFTLTDSSKNGFKASAPSAGQAGEYTRQAGFLAYYEICDRVQKGGWTVVQDPQGRVGPYAYSGNQWVSFDDAAMIEKKGQLFRDWGISGVIIWAPDLDDFKNKCGCEANPLLSALNRGLGRLAGPSPDCKLIGKNKVAPGEVTTVSPGGTTASPSGTTDSSQTSCQDGTTVRDPSDCSKYKLCNHGTFIQLQCPNGLSWNVDRCDWPANTQCIDGGSIDNNEIVPKPSSTLRPVPSSTVATTTRKPTPTTTRTPTVDSGYKVICYFTNWAWYRPGDGKYTPDNIDDSLCTHIVYGFATLDTTSLIMKPYDSWADLDNNFYKRVVALQEKGVRVSIALGGWNDSAGDKYSRLVNDPAARARFVTSAIQFLEKYGFDGLDLDWEYPKCWQVNCKAGPASDKEGFAAWIQELSAEFKPRGWTLSAAVSPSKAVINDGYDVPALSEYLDWIGVMTYDYHGNWDKKTGHVSPLYTHPDDEFDYFNTNFTMNYWKELGADSKKLTLGVPLYGQSFSLSDNAINGLNAKSFGPGEAGEYTRQGGFLAYYEICDRIQKGGWTVVQDPEGRMGPYAYKGSQWVSFDDTAMIKRKAELLKEWNLAGVIVWAPDLDDFRNKCGCESHALLRALNRGLGRLSTPDPNCSL